MLPHFVTNIHLYREIWDCLVVDIPLFVLNSVNIDNVLKHVTEQFPYHNEYQNNGDSYKFTVFYLFITFLTNDLNISGSSVINTFFYISHINWWIELTVNRILAFFFSDAIFLKIIFVAGHYHFITIVDTVNFFGVSTKVLVDDFVSF